MVVIDVEVSLSCFRLPSLSAAVSFRLSAHQNARPDAAGPQFTLSENSQLNFAYLQD